MEEKHTIQTPQINKQRTHGRRSNQIEEGAANCGRSLEQGHRASHVWPGIVNAPSVHLLGEAAGHWCCPLAFLKRQILMFSPRLLTLLEWDSYLPCLVGSWILRQGCRDYHRKRLQESQVIFKRATQGGESQQHRHVFVECILHAWLCFKASQGHSWCNSVPELVRKAKFLHLIWVSSIFKVLWGENCTEE